MPPSPYRRPSSFSLAGRLLITLLAIYNVLNDFNLNNNNYLGLNPMNSQQQQARHKGDSSTGGSLTHSYSSSSYQVLAATLMIGVDTRAASPIVVSTSAGSTSGSSSSFNSPISSSDDGIVSLTYCFNRLNDQARDLYRRGVKSLMGEVNQFCLAYNCTSEQLEQIVYCASFDIFEHYCRALLIHSNGAPRWSPRATGIIGHINIRPQRGLAVSASAFVGAASSSSNSASSSRTLHHQNYPSHQNNNNNNNQPEDPRQSPHRFAAIWRQLLQPKSYMIEEAQLHQLESSMEALLAKSLAWMRQDQDGTSDANEQQLC